MGLGFLCEVHGNLGDFVAVNACAIADSRNRTGSLSLVISSILGIRGTFKGNTGVILGVPSRGIQGLY